MSIKRLDNFGKINRKKVLSFSWENKNHFGYEGDSLASALLANNIKKSEYFISYLYFDLITHTS